MGGMGIISNDIIKPIIIHTRRNFMSTITVSILGVGARGGEAYGSYVNDCKDKYKIVSLCDANPSKIEKYSALFNVRKEDCYLNEEEFLKEKRSDLLIIATLDQDHVRLALKAIKLGYAILLEKPISDNVEELVELQKTAKEYGTIIVVCHVLRYTVAIRKIKELIDAKKIGELVSFDSLEQVAYWHYAHSYVRGNWRSSKNATPMIMAKCCHDLDLMQYFADSKCESLSSVGSLRYFKPENKPEGATDRCINCKHVDTCAYSAKRIYVDEWNLCGKPNAWPFTVLSDKELTEEELFEKLKTTRYGECVFNGYNDVVDHQFVTATFENGVTANLNMMAFTKGGGRIMRFFGTEGEILYDEAGDHVTLKRFGGENEVYVISKLTDDLTGHGGGDHRMIDAVYEVLKGNADVADTSLDRSIESHLMAIASEKSRLSGGERVKIHID